MRRLRLLQITHDLAIGGLQQVVINICRAIDTSKFDVSILCLKGLGEYASEAEKMGIKVYSLPQKKNHTDYFSFLKIAKILKNEKIDIVHTHNTSPFIDGTLAAILSGVKGRIHTDHARNFPDKKRYMFAEWLMSHFVDVVVGVSEHTSQNLIVYEHISPKKIRTIANGIYGEKFNIDIGKFEKRRELCIKQNGPIIGIAARLSEQKGIVFLLEAVKLILVQNPDVSLIIAGNGPLEESLKYKSNSLGIAENVYFIGPRLDVPELLKLFDILVLPSLYEGLPLILLEALAAGCPVVASDVGGSSMVIKKGVNGSLIDTKDTILLAAEINKVLSDQQLSQKYINNGLDIFHKEFSAEVMTRKYEELYLAKFISH